ncbi:glycosyltransferase family 4 protein [Candidatus Microgenomates bacterium]|nr:glycosyltransferase family 4 protein [Candidatus Microgenomates bacterium]
MISIALVKPPQAGGLVRGSGYYVDHLLTALSRRVRVSLVEFSFLPGAYKKFDLVHFPYFDEYFFTLPPVLPKRAIVSILDCTKLKFKDHFPIGPRGKVAWSWQKNRAVKATAVITISNSAKTDIETFFHIPAAKINVTYLAADPIFKPVKIKKESFVLYVGGVNWNKNLPTLIRACQKIKTSLILVGQEFLARDADLTHIENQPLKEILSLIKNDPRVKIPGFVPAADLVKLYNQAKVYVQPSIYEGFGLPVLEAMSCGTPVVCGRSGSLSEIAGAGATYADVTSVDDLAQKIATVRPTGKEIAQAKRFSWGETAKMTEAIYEKILASH